MSAHTPGPWRTYSIPVGRTTYWGVHANAMSMNDAEGEANARLIAAAPDLLAACRELLDAHDTGQWGLPNEIVGLLRAAIAKATGEAAP